MFAKEVIFLYFCLWVLVC